LLLRGIGEKGANSGQLTSGRCCTEPLRSAVGKEGAKVGGLKVKKV
jgi:hypothetical protein